jgi:NitT/TauT family transport system permease protein
MNAIQMFLARAALLGGVLLAWAWLPAHGYINPALLPPLGEVLETLWQLLQRSQVHQAIGVSSAEVLVAFVIAVPLGTLLGALIAEYAYLGAIFKPFLFYVFSIPKSIFLPMFILVFGISFTQKVAYATFTTTFVVLMSAAACVESIKQEYILVARSYGATRLQLLRRVYLPSMLPLLLETIRIAMIFNFTAVLIAEMYASRTGMGHLISGWGENFQMRQLFAGIVLLSLIAIVFNEAVRFLETRCSTWRT